MSREGFNKCYGELMQNSLAISIAEEGNINSAAVSANATENSLRGAPNKNSFMGIVSSSPDMLRAFDLIKKVARTNSTVLILGESGTGKELIANAVHKLSGRMGRLVPVNCGAIPEDILESELFGHEKGSFTGAIANKIGRFQLAHGGTIFLDEIGDMSPKLQVKLLRVLQERKVEPVGAAKSIDLDVRVIAATNKDLREEVKAGRFREDLYYRLQVVPVELPKLTERSGDIMLLARHFMDKFCQQFGKNTINFAPEAEAIFNNYNWPGNVRELENLVERLAILCDHKSIYPSDLPPYLLAQEKTSISSANVLGEIPQSGVDFNKLVDDFESHLINSALNRTNGNKKAAAKLLNLNRTTLVEKIKKKGLAAQIEVSVEA